MLGTEASTITVKVRLDLRQRGGRKLVVLPDGAPFQSERRTVDETLLRGLARAFRWRRDLDRGLYGTLAELASAKRVTSSYASRVLRLTLLAPDIVEAILDGHQPPEMQLEQLLDEVPESWVEQRRRLIT